MTTHPSAMRFLAVIGIALGAATAVADDRDLLRTGAADPFVFIVFDTSGSMNWRIGDSMPSMRGDADDSKLYQAKEALFEVVSVIDDLHFGFNTYNQDVLTLRAKHWLYTAGAGGVDVPGFGIFPPPGSEDVFGRTFTCTRGGSSVGCDSGNPAHSDNVWEMRRIRMLPKLGDPAGASSSTTFFFETTSTGDVYRVTYTRNPPGVPNVVGSATLDVDVRVCRLSGSSCSSSFDHTNRITYTLVGDFVGWDIRADDAPEGFFGQGQTVCPASGESDILIRAGTSNNCDGDNQNLTCKGWDPNDDPTLDPSISGYNHRHPNFTPSPEPTPVFTQSFMQYGDVIPFDWRAGRKNRDLVMQRLAPNLIASPSAIPDFRVAPYLEDAPTDGNLKGKSIPGLPLDDANRFRPIMASGATPLGHSIKNFREFVGPWRDLAAVHDVDWSCRNVYLLLLTDGNETCNTNAGGQTTSLRVSEGVKTFVVGFGVPESAGGDTLDDIADRGGTGEPFRPQTPEELVQALLDIFQRIREETRAFASAAVPSVQAEVADKIYLTSFTPLRNESVWIGHADTYLKPLPLTDDGRPNRARVCTGDPDDSACFVWDAAVELLDQAPDTTQVLTDRMLGPAIGQRRVLYPKAAIAAEVGDPQRLRLFDFPSTTADKWDLWEGMQIPFVPGDTTSESAAQARAEEVIKFTLAKRIASVDSPQQTGEVLPANCTRISSLEISCEYLMGDVFHADPQVVSNPNNFAYFAGDIDGYRDFFLRGRFRRKMLLTATNDGQLHAYDAGTFEEAANSPLGNEILGRFNNGTGSELFSFIPRLALPDVRLLAEIDRHRFVVDGTPQVADVFIDPQHIGLPDPDAREWRTVAIGGLREGGSERCAGCATFGYYALDVTQPDRLIERKSAADVVIGYVPESTNYVPSCMKAGVDCGGRAFPALLWELTDTSDDDFNGSPDLGETWSKPNTGRVRVRDAVGNILVKEVAIFGGGMDPLNMDLSGNFLYMVDIETGKTMYKRRLDGSAPSEPAAVDTDQDGLLDRIYIGTTLGFLYKVDLRSVPDLDALGQVPLTSPAWQPLRVFDTGGRPIFYPPAVVFVTHLSRFALAFGTGNREDLWDRDARSVLAGRFYMVVDDNWDASTPDLPRTEDDYQAIGPNDLVANPGTRDFLQVPPFGWFLTLDAEERVITPAFSLAGITVFTSYQPVTCLDRDADGICDDVDPDPPEPPLGADEGDNLCARTGDSRIFVIFTTSGDPVITLAGEKTRYWQLGGSFVTEPYTEQSATKNPPSGDVRHADQLSPELEEIRQTLQGLFPPGYRFANFRIDIKTIRSDTGVFFIAPVPVGMLEANWKEF